MKRIAVLNDLSGFGRCSLTAALPIISAHGIEACPLPTGIYSNQTGYESYASVDMTPYLPAFMEEWRKLGAKFDGILTGFIPNSEQGDIIEAFINEFKTEQTLLLVDPIMGDDGVVYDNFDEQRIAAVRALAKKADIITPNVTELALLCGEDCKRQFSLQAIEQMAKSLGPRTVVTGIQMGAWLGTAVWNGQDFDIVRVVRQGEHFSGTGDIFAAYVLSRLVAGACDTVEAVTRACNFISCGIEATLSDMPALPYHAEGIEFERFLNIV